MKKNQPASRLEAKDASPRALRTFFRIAGEWGVRDRTEPSGERPAEPQKLLRPAKRPPQLA